jgi:tetratricopeptide (TPR) repeat protein
VRYLKTADELQPNNMGILAILGSALHYNKDDKNAIIALEKSISLYENRPNKTEKDKNMSSTYSDLAEIYTYSLKDMTKAMELIEKGKKEFPDVKAFDLLELNFYLSGDNIELGIQKFEKAIAESPNSEEIHLAYASLLEKKGDLEAATKIYEKVLGLNSSSFNANYNLAAMYANKAVEFKKLEDQTEDYSKAGEYAKSAETFFTKSLPYMEKAHQLDKEDIPTINGLVQVYTQLNMMEKSNEFIQLRNKLQGK